jgi:hypothetical protein
MDRRDFLRLRTSGRVRVADLSCERLYVQYVNAASRPTRGQLEEPASADSTWLPSGGEPPTHILEPTKEELLEDLARQLAAAEVVRVLDAEWLVNHEFRQDLETLLESIRARGCQVEFLPRRG